MQQHGKGNLQQGQQGKNNKQNRPQRPQGGILSDRKDSSPGRVPSRTAVPQDSSKAVLKTRTAAASRAANSSLTKNVMKNRRLKASMQAATAATCTAATI